VEPLKTQRAIRGGLEPRDKPRRQVLLNPTRLRQAEALTNGHVNKAEDKVWLPESYITRNRGARGRRVCKVVV